MVKLIERKVEQAGEKYRVVSVVEMDKREIKNQLDEFENQAESMKATKDKITSSLNEYRKKSAEEIKKEVTKIIERFKKLDRYLINNKLPSAEAKKTKSMNRMCKRCNYRKECIQNIN